MTVPVLNFERDRLVPLQQTLYPQPSAKYVLNDLNVTVTCECLHGSLSQAFHCDGRVHVYQLLLQGLDCDTVHLEACVVETLDVNPANPSLWWLRGLNSGHKSQKPSYWTLPAPVFSGSEVYCWGIGRISLLPRPTPTPPLLWLPCQPLRRSWYSPPCTVLCKVFHV